LGFFSDTSEIATTTEIDLTIARSCGFKPMKIFSAVTAFNAYRTGIAITGEGVIFIK